MSKQDPKITEYTPTQETGTYQTGSTQPPKHYRGLIAVLLITVTCLGGLASALGIANIHLLLELSQNRVGTAPLSVHLEAAQPSSGPKTDDRQAPTLPEQGQWNLDFSEPKAEILPSAQEILSKNTHSTVSIQCQYISGSTASVTGVVVDAAGYILTNAHPVSDASRILVTLSDGRQFPAALVGTDGFTDLAVLFIDASGLTAAEFVRSDALDIGDFLATVCGDQRLQEGFLRHHGDSHIVGNEHIHFMQTDLDEISGPVYNSNGQIVGFGSDFLSDCCSCHQQDTALSTVTVKTVVEQLITMGTVSGRPCLDAEMEEVQALYQCYWDLPGGLRITHVNENSLAHLAGLETGDILIALNGQPITDWASYYHTLWTLRPGQQVNATIFREGRQSTITITIAQSGT